MDGWVKVHRKIWDNKIWTSEPFTRGQAWIDLLLLANHEYGYFYLRDHKVEVERGQVGWSQLKLATRWKWSRTKVRKFLNDLEKEQQIKQQQSHTTSIITIIKYEEYQQKEQQGIQQQDNRKTTERQQKDTNKKNKEELRNKEIYTSVEDFYKNEIEKHKTEQYIEKYKKLVDLMFGRNEKYPKLESVLKLRDQLTYNEFYRCYSFAEQEPKLKFYDYLESMDNWKDLLKKNISVGKTLLNWMRRERKSK